MEQSLVFMLFLAGFPLIQSLPMLMNGANVMVNTRAQRRSISELVEEANKGVPYVLFGGDMNRKPYRSATYCNRCLWKKSQNGKVPVPFVLSSTYGNSERSVFNTVMKEFEMMTCIQFVNRTTEQDYLSIESGSGCWSYVGKVGGKQMMSLSSSGCITHGLIQHELMHSLGFYHEHNRSDRDDYINIMWQNIAQADRSNFDIDDGNLQNLPYDYKSIMHYGKNAYSNVANQPSMVPKPDSSITIGQGLGMDNLDVIKINTIYNCDLCRKKFVEPSGTFAYSSTSSGSSCLYLIQSTDMVLLQLSDINVPSSPGCNVAYIKVYDGVSTSSPVLLEKTCGNNSVLPLISTGSHMLIETVNNQPSAESRFSASYETVEYGNTFTTDDGVVTSPLFPSFYPSNQNVVNVIIAPKGYKVLLTFYYFSIPTSSGCSTDYLTVTDGPIKTSLILGSYCGSITIPTKVVSTGSPMVLYFRSGDNTSYNGFYATYKFVTVN